MTISVPLPNCYVTEATFSSRRLISAENWSDGRVLRTYQEGDGRIVKEITMKENAAFWAGPDLMDSLINPFYADDLLRRNKKLLLTKRKRK